MDGKKGDLLIFAVFVISEKGHCSPKQAKKQTGSIKLKASAGIRSVPWKLVGPPTCKEIGQRQAPLADAESPAQPPPLLRCKGLRRASLCSAGRGQRSGQQAAGEEAGRRANDTNGQAKGSPHLPLAPRPRGASLSGPACPALPLQLCSE